MMGKQNETAWYNRRYGIESRGKQPTLSANMCSDSIPRAIVNMYVSWQLGFDALVFVQTKSPERSFEQNDDRTLVQRVE